MNQPSCFYSKQQCNNNLSKTHKNSTKTQKDKFLKALNKKVGNEKQQGDKDEKKAYPIPVGLYVIICIWDVSFGNIFLWSWTKL